MLVSNIYIVDGLVNGACGKLQYILWGVDKNDKETILSVYLHFENEKIGKCMRQKDKNNVRKHNLHYSWTRIDYVIQQVRMKSQDSAYQVFRKQFPLNCAEEKTIHKAQGSTSEKVVIHIKGNINFDIRAWYVARSRATSVKSIFIDGQFRETQFNIHDKARLEMERLRNERPMSFSQQFSQDLKNSGNVTVLFNNIRSLTKHL